MYAAHHDPRPHTLTDSGAIYGDFDELCDALYYAREAYGETYAQHRSECHAYGDSWPGAQIQLSDMARGIAQLERIVRGHPAQGAPHRPEPVEAVDVDDDLPF